MMRFIRAACFGRRHLLYDSPASPARAEALLLAGDFLMLAAPVFLATAILHRPESAGDAAFLAVWLMIPRALARCLSWMERPREPIKVYAASAAFVVTVSVLLFAGWELIYTENRKYIPIGHGTAGVVILAWVVTIFLFHPRAYRLYDFFCGSVLLLALLEAKPEAWLWVPLFFAGFLVSAATRHLLHDVVHGLRHRQVPLQNARMLAAIGTLIASLVFFAIYFSLHRGLDFPRASDLAGVETAYRYSSPLIARTPQGRDRRAAVSVARGGAELVDRERRGYRLRILSYASRPESREVAWRVRPVDGRGRVAGWPPRAGALWRALSLSTFDPDDDAWVETSPLRTSRWPESGTLGSRATAPPSRAPPLDLEYRVELPLFRNLIALHRHDQFTESSWIRSVQSGEAGDLFPSPGLEPGSTYRARSRMEFPNPRPFPPETGASAADLSPGLARRCLGLPDAEKLGIDPAAIAGRIFAGASTVGQKVAALERYFRRRGFLYLRDEVWSGAGEPYRRFFEETRTGNCTHYATSSALLLRAAGVRTRFVAGFAGGRWDAETRTVLLEVSMAHAWTEVHVPGRGWYAVDATAWVPAAARSPEAAESGLPLPAAAGDSLAGGPSRGGSASSGAAAGMDLGGDEPSGAGGGRHPAPGASGGEQMSAGQPRARTDGTGRRGDEDYSSWFEFTRLPRRAEDESTAASAEGAAGGDGVLPPREEILRAGRDGTGESTLDAPRRDGQRSLGIALRILIVATAALVALLVLVTYRFARKRQVEAETLEDEEEDESLPDPFDQGLATEVELYGESSPRGIIVSEYQRLQRDLAPTRKHRRRHQTPLEHASWLARRFEEIRGSLRSVVDLLYRAVYGHGDVTPDDAREHRESCRRVRRYMR